MSVRQSAALAEDSEFKVRVGADVPLVSEETGCFLWVIQQPEVVAQESRLSPSRETTCRIIQNI